MLDKLPDEVFQTLITHYVPAQQDRVSLSYVSRSVYDSILPILYKNIYLNEKPYVHHDMEVLQWSVLVGEDTIEKFRCLLETLYSTPSKFGPCVQNVYLTWRWNTSIMLSLVNFINLYASNFKSFQNCIDTKVWSLLRDNRKLSYRTILPHNKLPIKTLHPLTGQSIELPFTYNLKHLSIHVNPFVLSLQKKLQLISLQLNLRPDYQPPDNMELSFSDLFDTESLQVLEIISWYHDKHAHLDVYDIWKLDAFWLEFHSIRSLTLLSLFPNDAFLVFCMQNLSSLQKLRVNYMSDHQFPCELIKANLPIPNSLQYLEITMRPLDPYVLSVVDHEDTSFFQINQKICHCAQCRETIQSVLIAKMFPNAESYKIKDFNDIETKDFVLQMFKLNSVIPYSQFYDSHPSIAYNTKTFAHLATKISGIDDPNDLLKLYHCHIHSFKRTFDFFNQMCPNLQYLVVNDIPTKVCQVDDNQKCNIPLFYAQGYKSNQIYELVTDESLFD